MEEFMWCFPKHIRQSEGLLSGLEGTRKLAFKRRLISFSAGGMTRLYFVGILHHETVSRSQDPLFMDQRAPTVVQVRCQRKQ